MAKAIIPVVDRFMQYVSPEPNSGCWLWLGSTARHGYGSFWMNGKLRPAHRAAMELMRGPIADGLYVLHGCDNVACVNPDHLSTGTQKDNGRDMARRGRGPKSKRGFPYGVGVQKNGTFCASVWRGGHRKFLGSFATVEAAAVAAIDAKEKMLSEVA